MSAKDDRYNHSEKGRTRWRRYYNGRLTDPTPDGTKSGMTKGERFQLLEAMRSNRRSREATLARTETALAEMEARHAVARAARTAGRPSSL